MEFKKKTIIGEDNNTPPKDYIGVKSDGKAYEYDYYKREGVESKTISLVDGNQSEDTPQDGETVELEEITITENGTTTAEEGKGFNKVIVNVPYVQKKSTELNCEDDIRLSGDDGSFNNIDIDEVQVPDLYSENVFSASILHREIITGRTLNEFEINVEESELEGADVRYYDMIYSYDPPVENGKMYFVYEHDTFEYFDPEQHVIQEFDNQEGNTVYAIGLRHDENVM